jgi:hypothetical protein
MIAQRLELVSLIIAVYGDLNFIKNVLFQDLTQFMTKRLL